MATMRFTVPDEVRDKFERAFRDHDRSAVVTGLLILAVQAEERQRRIPHSLVERLRRVRGDLPQRTTGREREAAGDAPLSDSTAAPWTREGKKRTTT